MPRDPVKNRANTARTRQRQKEYQAWKKQTLARWLEHHVFHKTKQADGGWRVSVEHTPEGDRITAEIAELCGLDSDTVIQRFVGEVLTQEGGVWIPTKKKGS